MYCFFYQTSGKYDHIIFMAQWLLSNNLTMHFQARFKQYLLVLELFEDKQLLCVILDFLNVKDIVELAACSKQLEPILGIPQVEVRLLRAKVEYYEKPKIREGINLRLFYMPIPIIQNDKTKNQKIKKSYESLLRFNKEMRFFKFMKKQGVVKNKKQYDSIMKNQGYGKFSVLEDEFKQEESRLLKSLSFRDSWQNVQKDQMQVFKKYKAKIQSGALPRMRQSGLNKTSIPAALYKKSQNQKVSQSTLLPTYQSLEEKEHHEAYLDYQKRKMMRLQPTSLKNKNSEQTRRSMKQSNSTSSQAYNRNVIEQQKKKRQQENIAMLNMKKTQPWSQDKLKRFEESLKKDVEVKVVKQSFAGQIVGQVWTGIKVNLWGLFNKQK